MTIEPEPCPGFVAPGRNLPSSSPSQFPEIIMRAGKRATFAADEFFFGRIRNEHTRAAYMVAVKRFLRSVDRAGLELNRITPRDVGLYLDGLRNENTSVATRKQHLAALRHFFDVLVTRHAMILNPALSVRGERYQVVEGKTPEITVKGARQLLHSINTITPVGLRDRAIVGVLIYTAARAGAVASLKRGSLYYSADQWMLHFDEKGGKSREIPVRHDLSQMLSGYIDAAGIRDASKDTPLFRTARRKTGRLTEKQMSGVDVYRMFKRRAEDAGLPAHLSPHSVRVTALTDLLEQNAPMEDVQRLAGHADPRTTGLYDRRQKKITRNIVERISI